MKFEDIIFQYKYEDAYCNILRKLSISYPKGIIDFDKGKRRKLK